MWITKKQETKQSYMEKSISRRVCSKQSNIQQRIIAMWWQEIIRIITFLKINWSNLAVFFRFHHRLLRLNLTLRILWNWIATKKEKTTLSYTFSSFPQISTHTNKFQTTLIYKKSSIQTSNNSKNNTKLLEDKQNWFIFLTKKFWWCLREISSMWSILSRKVENTGVYV